MCPDCRWSIGISALGRSNVPSVLAFLANAWVSLRLSALDPYLANTGH